jgi:hypothetical protein
MPRKKMSKAKMQHQAAVTNRRRTRKADPSIAVSAKYGDPEKRKKQPVVFVSKKGSSNIKRTRKNEAGQNTPQKGKMKKYRGK